MTKLIAVLSVAAVATIGTPRGVAASDCTEDYMKCINDAGMMAEPFQSLKDVECGAGYVGCVGSLLKFW